MYQLSKITQIVTNGNEFKVSFDSGNVSTYIKLEQVIQYLSEFDFSKETLDIFPNQLVLNHRVAIKLSKKLEKCFGEYGYKVVSNIENVNGESGFDIFGKSYIKLRK